MSEEAVVLDDRSTLLRRGLHFVGRVALGLVVTYAAVFLLAYEGRLVREESVLEYPLWVALEEIGASVQETVLTATASVDRRVRPTMAELKRLAQKSLDPRLGPHTKFWSEVEPHYRVVYFRGQDPSGGTWTVSAQHRDGPTGLPGPVTLAFTRSVLGRYSAVPPALHRMKHHLERSLEMPLPDASLDVRVEARPPKSAGRRRVIDEFFGALEAETRSVTSSAESVLGAGYTPRLSGWVREGNQQVNVMARVKRHGQGDWLEIGSPGL